MESPHPSSSQHGKPSLFKTRRKRIIAGVIAALLIGTVVGYLAVFFIKKNKHRDDTQKYSKYVAAYTSGTVSKKSFIRVELASQVKTMSDIGVADTRNLFSFSPSVKGKTFWIDAQTVEFRPDKPLKAGEDYEVSFDLEKVTETEKGLEEFEFDFRVIRPGMSATQQGLVSQNNTSMDYMQLKGEIRTSDQEDPKAIEKALEVDFEDKLKVKWEHHPEQNSYAFTIDSIRKTSQLRNLKLRWSGEPIHAEAKGAMNIQVPGIGVFSVLDIKAIQDQEDYALVQLSQPVNVAQDLSGLIVLSGVGYPRYTIDRSQVKIYSGSKLEGNYGVQVNPGIENIEGAKLRVAKTANIVFENRKPSVTIAGGGTIIPNSGKLVLPFEAVNLNAVDVTIIKIYENNIPQFFQGNNYNSGYDLRRVAKPVVQKTVRLDENKALDLHKKNRFTLDLDKLLKTEPGAIYRVMIGFRQGYNVYKCAEGGNGARGDSEDLEDALDEEYYGYAENLDEDDRFWQLYGNAYPRSYRWEDRDNPCTRSYYTSDKWATRNIIASNIGLIVKRGNDNSMLILTTDLRTAKTLSGVSLELLDYQRQVIHTVKTDGDGMAKFDLKRKPFMLIAKNGDERGYLKLDDGSSLPLSRFDVGGDVVQNGLKGFIYGERGVWRPGDSVYLSFILEDKLKTLPGGYPVTFELYNPKGQLFKRVIKGKPLNGFYAFKTATESTSTTGNWLVKVKAGGAVFSKTVKIETVMPNRLKIGFDIGNAKYLGSGVSSAVLSANWLFGAVGKNLKAKVDVNLNTMKTTFKGYEAYTFDNPTVVFQSQVKTLFEGTLNEKGTAVVNTNLSANKTAPGVLKANFTTKVFEAGGGFSIDNFSIPYHVYTDYYGIKTPEGNRLSGMLVTGKDHKIELVNVDRKGVLVKTAKNVDVELYKVQWRWWWEQDDQYTFANFTQNTYNKLIKKERIALRGGKGNWTLRIDEPEWGRYLILVRDLNGGHVTGKSVYVDWPGWAQREQASNPTEASMLSFTANKTKYNVGEDVVLTIPSGAGGRALISIENGSRVLKTFWTDTKAGQTQFTFKAEQEMAPNVFANVTLLQPHAQTVNDLPIRMYGAIPLLIENPQTVLKPVIQVAEKLKPETESTVSVSEASGKAMTYTIAIVDEGLLDLTRFKTPDAHAVFYAREGLGVKTWDLFDYVLGAWGGNLDRLLSIGGDGSINRNLDPAKANRFVPVVKYLGPFALSKGGKATHKFKLPQYIGAIRVMVVAGQDGAYGSAEKSVQVKKPLMLLATLPRVIGPGETFTLPATVFATESNLKNVRVQLEAQNLQVLGSKTQQLVFKQPGEQLAYFEVKAPEITGVAKIRVMAQSGAEKAVYEVELDIRNPNPYVTNVVSATVDPGKKWSYSYNPVGMAGSNSATLEVSNIFPINLKKRLEYLVQYPHGCVEQVTSAVFPQLFLKMVTPLSEQQQASIAQNVKTGILRLRGFQNTDGGLSYWPGEGASDEWGTNYASHFLLEAEKEGYALPVGMLDGLLRYLRSKASGWAPNSTNFYGGDLSQAYRLYALALAKRPDMAAMNRLRGFEYLSPAAKWRLAAAYQLAGQADAARGLIKGLPREVKPYTQLGGTYGSDTRDEAMILETLTLMGQNTGSLLLSVANKLGNDRWYSTQTTAYSLLAVAKACGKNGSSGNTLKYTYSINGKPGQVNFVSYLNSSVLTDKGTVMIYNTGDRKLFTRLVLQGQPAAGQNNFAAADPSVLDMSIAYKLLNGKALDPSSLKQGTDFYAEVRIKNPGKMGYYEQMALTQIFPSGWEIINTRVNDNESILASSPYTYRDIRDDRVFTYFNLRENEAVVYKVLLNASYIGRYYLSAVQCEAMYNSTISATEGGRWVQVVK